MLGGASLTCEKCPICGVDLDLKEYAEHLKLHVEDLMRNLLQAGDSIGEDQSVCKDGARFKSVIEDLMRNLLEADDSIREPQFVCPECNTYKSSRKMVLLHLANCKEDLEAGLEILSSVGVPNAAQKYDAAISRRKFAIAKRAFRTKLELARLKIQKKRLRAAPATTITPGFSGFTDVPEIDSAWAEIRETDKHCASSNTRKAFLRSKGKGKAQDLETVFEIQGAEKLNGTNGTGNFACETSLIGAFGSVNSGTIVSADAFATDLVNTNVERGLETGRSFGFGSEGDLRDVCAVNGRSEIGNIVCKTSEIGAFESENRETIVCADVVAADLVNTDVGKGLETGRSFGSVCEGYLRDVCAEQETVNGRSEIGAIDYETGSSFGCGKAVSAQIEENRESKSASAQGSGDGEGSEAINKATRRRPSKKLVTGRKGERTAFNYFSSLLVNKKVTWLNALDESGKPYDILVEDKYKNREFIEVKSTSASNKDWFFITLNEFDFARKKGESYTVAHVVLAHRQPPKITVYRNPVKSGQLMMAMHPRK